MAWTTPGTAAAGSVIFSSSSDPFANPISIFAGGEYAGSPFGL